MTRAHSIKPTQEKIDNSSLPSDIRLVRGQSYVGETNSAHWRNPASGVAAPGHGCDLQAPWVGSNNRRYDRAYLRLGSGLRINRNEAEPGKHFGSRRCVAHGVLVPNGIRITTPRVVGVPRLSNHGPSF